MSRIFTGDIERAPKFYDVGWGKYRARLSITVLLATPHGKFGLLNGRTRKNSSEFTENIIRYLFFRVKVVNSYEATGIGKFYVREWKLLGAKKSSLALFGMI